MTKKATRPASHGTDQMVCRTETKSTSPRVCTSCGERKALAEMAPDCRKKNGYRSRCRKCRASYDRRRYQVKRASILAQQGDYRRTRPEIAWAASYRARARKYGLEPTVERFTYEDVIAQWGGSCVHCGTGPFEEIDHLIPVAAGGPHTLMNTAPCCRACNQRKRWTFDEWIIRDHHAAWAEQTLRLAAEPPNGVQQRRRQFRASNSRVRS